MEAVTRWDEEMNGEWFATPCSVCGLDLGVIGCSGTVTTMDVMNEDGVVYVCGDDLDRLEEIFGGGLNIPDGDGEDEDVWDPFDERDYDMTGGADKVEDAMAMMSYVAGAIKHSRGIGLLEAVMFDIEFVTSYGIADMDMLLAGFAVTDPFIHQPTIGDIGATADSLDFMSVKVPEIG